MNTAVPIIRGERGERRWFAGGGLWTIKATTEETDGAFTLIEDRMMRGKTTPLHTHPHEDETFIVLEGRSWCTSRDRAFGRPGWYRSGSARYSTCVPGDIGDGANSRAAYSWKRRGLLQGCERAVDRRADAQRPPDLDRLRAAAGQSQLRRDSRSAPV